MKNDLNEKTRKRKKRKLTDNSKLHNILSSLNAVNNGHPYPIRNVLDITFLEGLDETWVMDNLSKRAKEGFLKIIDDEMIKFG